MGGLGGGVGQLGIQGLPERKVVEKELPDIVGVGAGHEGKLKQGVCRPAADVLVNPVIHGSAQARARPG